MKQATNLINDREAQGLLFETTEAQVRPTVGLAKAIAIRLKGLLTGRFGNIRNRTDGQVPVNYHLFSFRRTVLLLTQMEAWTSVPGPEDLVDDTDWVSIARILENWEVFAISSHNALMAIETHLLVPEGEQAGPEDDLQVESLDDHAEGEEHPALSIPEEITDLADWADFQQAWQNLEASDMEHLLDLLVPSAIGADETQRVKASEALAEFVFSYALDHYPHLCYEKALADLLSQRVTPNVTV